MKNVRSYCPLIVALLMTISVPLSAANAKNDAKSGEAPTFYRNVLPILQENCQTCHRPSGLNLGGMIAPMQFVSYQETRPWAKSMARAVANREMPPWHASAEYNDVFRNERTLEQSEIDTIVEWSRSGARPGDEADAPAPLVWPKSEWSIPEPDIVLSLAEPYHVNDDLVDQNIFLPLEEVVLEEDEFVTAIEYKPGSTAVHHIIGFARLPGADGGFGGLQMLSGIAPGSEANNFPKGYGIPLPKGSKIMLQMHYHKEPGPGTEVWDQSSVAIRFADEPVRPLHVTAVGDPRKMYLPANTKDHFITSEQTFERGITLMALLPHMHYRGSSSQYVAIDTDGARTEFLDVPGYDFNWQTRYWFKEPLVLPGGTIVEVTMGYDNTTGNGNNPDPNVDVKWGDSTDEEMNLGFMYWAFTDPADDDAEIGGPLGGGRRQSSL